MQRASRLGAAGPKPLPRDPLRKLSPSLFIVVVFLFFLPFVTCNGVEVSGVQAATGITPPGSDPGGAHLAEAPEPFAFVSFLCAVAGIVLIRLGRTRGPLASALAAVTGSFALIGAAVSAGLTRQSDRRESRCLKGPSEAPWPPTGVDEI